MAEKVTIARAAEILGLNVLTVRVGIQTGELPIGSAIKMSEHRTKFHVSPYLLSQYTGLSVEQIKGVDKH
jgi:hypothetical protein